MSQVTVSFRGPITVSRPCYSDSDEVVLREMKGDISLSVYFTPKQIKEVEKLLWALREIEAGGDPLRLSTTSTHTADPYYWAKGGDA
jgi:hypothetical protein